MANPFGGDVNEAAAQAERLLARLDGVEKKVANISQEAERAGKKVRIPSTREPVVEGASTSETAGVTEAAVAEQQARIRQKVREHQRGVVTEVRRAGGEQVQVERQVTQQVTRETADRERRVTETVRNETKQRQQLLLTAGREQRQRIYPSQPITSPRYFVGGPGGEVTPMYGGGAGGGGRRPPAPPVPPSGGPPEEPQRPPRDVIGFTPLTHTQLQAAYGKDADAIANYQRGVGLAEQAEGRYNLQLAESQRASQRAMVGYRGLTQELRKHGAATTEFLTALGRGRATIGELGYQALATAGKFAAWTAAAGGIYGALGAITQVGRGAVESVSGIATLGRFLHDVDPQKASAGYREVARELNVGVGDVAQAQNQFARVFHNQADSLKAARVALLATKLDQIDAADSFRYFTAIVQEGQVPIERLPVLFDQISAAQRRMGARVAEVLPAVARSFGAVRNVGGDLSQLIALAATTQVATGQTGQSVGTAFYRGAASFFPKNQATIRGFGVDPSKGFTQALIDAVRKATELNGADRRRLSQAFFGPQYGGRFAALFGRGKQLDQALGVTSPSSARGSATQELHEQLKSVHEQVSSIGIELQALGANLAQSGVLSGLGVMLKTTREALRLTNDLLEVYNKLPAPLKTSAGALAQIYLAGRLLRRLNVGQALVERGGGSAALGGLIQGSPARQEFKNLQEGLDRELASLRDTGESYGRQIQQQAINAEVLRAQQGRVAARGPDYYSPRTTAERGLTDEQFLAGRQQAHLRDYAAATARAQDAERQLEESRLNSVYITEKVAAVEQRNNEIRTAGNQSATAGLARARAYDITPTPVAATPATLERPTSIPPREFGERITPAGIVLPSGTGPVERVQSGLRDEQAAVQAVEKEQGRLRQATSVASSGFSRAGQALGRAGQGVSLAAYGLAGSLRNAVAGISPMNAAFVALIAGSLVYEEFLKEVQTLDQRQAQYGQQIRSQSDLLAAQRQAQANANSQLPFLSRAYESFRDINAVSHLLPRSRASVDRDQNAELARYIAGVRRAQQGYLTHGSTERHTGGPTIGLTYESIEKQLRGDVADFRTGAISRAQFHRRYDELIAEENSSAEILIASYGHKPKDIRAAQQRLRDAMARTRTAYLEAAQANNRQGADPFADIASAGLTHVANQADLRSQTGRFLGRSGGGLDYAVRSLAYYTTRAFGHGKQTDSNVIAKLGQIQQDAVTNVQQYVSDATDAVSRLPQGAGRGAAANRIYDRALTKLRDARQNNRERVKQITERVAHEQKQISDLEGQKDDLRAPQGVRDSGVTHARPSTKALDDRIAKLRRQFKRDQSALSAMELAVAQVTKAIVAGISEITQSQHQTAQEETSNYLDLLQKRQDLQIARSPKASQGSATLNALRTRLAAAKQHGADEGTILDIETQIANQEQQNADDAKSKADDLRAKQRETIQSLFNLRKARTDDPVALAKLDQEQAKRLEAVGGTGNERRDARAQYITARRTREEAFRDRQIEDAELYHDIGKITDQQLAQVYERAIKDRKTGINYRHELKARLLRLQHDANSEASLDLSPGDIRLPTAYEIRRAVTAAQQGINITQSYSTTIHVHRAEDVPKVASVMESHSRGTARALRRAAGQR